MNPKEQREIKQEALAEITRLSKANKGKVTPALVVLAARPDESPLHQYFEWDDTKAGEKYREMQARTLLRACKIDHKVNHHKIQIPKYTRDPQAEPAVQGYVEVARIKTDADLAHAVLVREFAKIANALRTARHMASYFGLDSEIDTLTESMNLLRKRVESEVTLNA